MAIEALQAKLLSCIEKKHVKKTSRIVFINDGSKDDTLDLLKAHKTPYIHILSLSTNKGHQNALLAGLDYAKDSCDCAISLDCDLQDDINLVDEFIRKYTEGFEVVYGVRNERKEDSFFKRFSAEGFYKLMGFFGAQIVKNHADYRLLSQKALSCLLEFKEVNLFLRGLVPLIGFKSCNLYYARAKRAAGETKYPLFKMISFALEGITSFSIKPLRILTFLGAIICVGSLIFGIWALIAHFMGKTIWGWTSMIVPVYFLGGIQMLGLGILGEYIGKIYKETKQRPRYFIDEIIQ